MNEEKTPINVYVQNVVTKTCKDIERHYQEKGIDVRVGSAMTCIIEDSTQKERNEVKAGIIGVFKNVGETNLLVSIDWLLEELSNATGKPRRDLLRKLIEIDAKASENYEKNRNMEKLSKVMDKI